MDQHSVINNQNEGRLEVKLDDETALLQYEERNDTLVFLYTEVPEAFEGKGIGSLLASYALEWARSTNKNVKVYCAFVKGYMQRHPEYNDLLAK